ncbi:phospholipase D family protein [Marinobacter sp. LN3S78]|uniref:phospholipase D family protein n=1 Tax=Marinobacter sp. LN3S78 TaxID=3382300 RepID=UPI00387A9174
MTGNRYQGVPLALLLILLLAGCSLPVVDHGSDLTGLPESEVRETLIGRSVATLASRNPCDTGVYPLYEPLDAFASRVLLIRAAERTLDVQYYIWQEDTTGLLLLGELLEAADRGVRVRLLLDDNGIGGLDPLLAAMDSHPDIHVRLFNPFTVRSAKWLNFLTDFSRVNRRMHNKSMTADNALTVLGGRNIGDEYFGATPGALFVDLDVLAIGTTVPEVTQQFDRYWASESAYPLEALVEPVGASQRRALRGQIQETARSPEAQRYFQAVTDRPFVGLLLDGELELDWATARLVSDDPAKVLDQVDDSRLMMSDLARDMGPPGQSLELVSPYFVPTDEGVAVFERLEEKGVEVRILTNSAEATDVLVVHSGYARHRKELLNAGVELYEMRAVGAGNGGRGSSGFSLNSSSSLHAKTFAMDGDRVFVGSFNFDPRSAKLNTEMGLILQSPELARQLASVFGPDLTLHAYRVELDDDGDLIWRDGAGDVLTNEPGTNAFDRGMLWLFSLMPIEGLL